MPFDRAKFEKVKSEQGVSSSPAVFDPAKLSQARAEIQGEPADVSGDRMTVTPLIGQPFEVDMNRRPLSGVEDFLTGGAEELSRGGLERIAEAVPSPEPTGNLPRDIAAGAPRAIAETFAETAPSFVSPEALALGAAGKAAPGVARILKPIAKPVGRFLGRQASQLGKALTGVEPTDTARLFKNPKILFARSKEAASREFGEAARRAGAQLPPATTEEALESANRTVRRVLGELDKSGSIPRALALEGRKALDEVINKGSKSDRIMRKLLEQRGRLDQIVKSDPDLARADRIFSESAVASKFRRFLPRNKSGTPSVLRIFSSGALAGATGNPIFAAATAPISLGAATAGLGATSRGLGAVSRAITPMAAEAGMVAGALSNRNKLILDPRNPEHKKIAKEFMRLAKGNKKKARELALEAGYRLKK